MKFNWSFAFVLLFLAIAIVSIIGSITAFEHEKLALCALFTVTFLGSVFLLGGLL